MDMLFVMNAQDCFLSPQGTVYLGEAAETLKIRMASYLSTYSGKRLFLREVHAMDDTFFVNESTHSIATTQDCAICSQLKDKASDFFDHFRYDSFHGTSLESYLKREKVTSVTMIGVETHTSILFTAESLRNRGLSVTVIEPCCMSRDNYMHDSAISIMVNYLGVRIGA